MFVLITKLNIAIVVLLLILRGDLWLIIIRIIYRSSKTYNKNRCQSRNDTHIDA